MAKAAKLQFMNFFLSLVPPIEQELIKSLLLLLASLFLLLHKSERSAGRSAGQRDLNS